MNENGVHVGPIRFWRARTRSLLDAATVAKKANFLHANADRGPAGNSLKGKKPMIDPNSSDPSSATPEFTSEHGSCTLMDRFVMMVKGLVLFLFPRMVPFFEFSNGLEEECTNNQVEYESLLFGLEFLQSMGVKHVEAFGDSLLVVQQVSKVCQCYNGSLNAYIDKYLDIISLSMNSL